MDTLVEIHQDGAWRPAATLHAYADDRCRFEYLASHVFAEHPLPVSLSLPVGFEPPQPMADGSADHRVPAFLYDLLPQGRGRRFLVDRLGLADHDRLVLPLLLHGALNPIGCLRLTSAVRFYQDEAAKNPDASVRDGFDLVDIETKSESLLQHLASHAMLASGTTGVQGVAPKFLLTQDAHDRWFADMALDDGRACKHWLVKLPRGRTADDLLVHRHEMAYLRVAAACGLRVHHDPRMRGSMLFVRRFDRELSPAGVRRLHQESLASLAGLRGFGVPTSQNALLAALRAHVTDPLAETLEFLKRDVLNLALRNTDNHARNSAVQRLADGRVQLTPLYDFSPMFMDPEMVPRAIHWRDASGLRLDAWTAVVAGLRMPERERHQVASALRGFAKTVALLPDIARDCGVEPVVLEPCLPSIERQVEQLSALPGSSDG